MDTLEVALREQEDLVDHIFLVQMMKTTLKQLFEERRMKVAQLIRTVAHLKARGRWVY